MFKFSSSVFGRRLVFLCLFLSMIDDAAALIRMVGAGERILFK